MKPTDIAEQRYNSTYGFVRINELDIQAEEFFGKDWEAEDDVNQITNLLKYIGRGDLIVSFIEGLQEDDILVSSFDTESIRLQDIKRWFDTQNFESDSVGGVISALLGGTDLTKTLINSSAQTFKHISMIEDDTILLSTKKPIGYCNRTGDYVFPTDVDKYDAVCPTLDENVDLGEFTLPILEDEENPSKFDWSYIKYIQDRVNIDRELINDNLHSEILESIKQGDSTVLFEIIENLSYKTALFSLSDKGREVITNK